MKRRLAVILAADMVDYSKRMEADQSDAIGLIQSLRERWLEPEVLARGGEVLKRLGDGWIIAFGSVSDAVEAAIAVQQSLAGHPQIKLRLAAHLGEIVDDGADLYGAGINVASRLQAEAPPGGVMISEDLHRQLDDRLGGRFSDAGSFSLKNIAAPITGFQWRPERRDQAPVDDVPMIAVEPVAATPDRQDLREAAADLQEQLVHRLARRTGIRVVELDAEGQGEASPTYLLRGRLRGHGEEARLTLTLLLRADNSVIWSDVYNGDADDVFALCDTAVERSDNDLRLQINAFDGQRLAALPDDNLSPSELRARAAQLLYQVSMESQERAVAVMDRALLLDPGNAMSLAMWVEARFILAAARFEALDAAMLAKLTAAADRAVQSAPRSDYVFYVRALWRAGFLGDVDGARGDVARIIRINPNYALRYEAEGIMQLAAGEFDAAARTLGACIELSERDPYLPFRIYAQAVALLLAGQPGEAAKSIGEAIELRRECRPYWLLLAEARTREGADRDAADARDVAARLPDQPDVLAQRLALPAAEQPLMRSLAPGRSHSKDG